MSVYLPYIIAIICLLIGFFWGSYFRQLKFNALLSSNKEREDALQRSLIEHQNRLNDEKQDKENIRSEKDGLAMQLTRTESERDNLLLKLAEQSRETEKLQEKFTKEFENLANKILEEKSTKFTEQNRENIKNILHPLQEKIKDFEQKVEHSQKENISIHSALKQQLVDLQNQNIKITKEAENLTKALKGDSKMQGNWGELVLEKVLEKSNLEKGREYTVQESFIREDGSRVVPDVVVHLPDGKKMIID